MIGQESAPVTKHENGYVGHGVHGTIENSFCKQLLFDAATKHFDGRKEVLNASKEFETTPSRVNADDCKHSDFELHHYSGIPKLENFEAPLRTGYGLHICHAQMIPQDDLVEFDRKIAGYDRRQWLLNFLQHSNCEFPGMPGSVSLVVTRNEGDISAWGTIRPAYGRPLLGPLYSEDEKSTRLLLRGLVDSLPAAKEEGIQIVLLSNHPNAAILMEEIGLSRTDSMQPTFYPKPAQKISTQFQYVLALSCAELQLV